VPEDHVRQRTGHVSSELRRYREFAESVADLKLEELTPLHEAIPELARVGQKVGQNVAHVEKRRKRPAMDDLRARGGAREALSHGESNARAGILGGSGG
jgi:hypothetical protein